MWTGAGCQRVESSVEPDAHDSTGLIKPGPKWFHKTSDYFKPCQCWDNTRTNRAFGPAKIPTWHPDRVQTGDFFLFGQHECVPKLCSKYQGFHGSVRVAIGRLPATGLQSQHSIFNQFQPSQYVYVYLSYGELRIQKRLHMFDTGVDGVRLCLHIGLGCGEAERGFVLVSVLKTSRNNVSFGFVWK